jgi:hypothetical protein
LSRIANRTARGCLASPESTALICWIERGPVGALIAGGGAQAPSLQRGEPMQIDLGQGNHFYGTALEIVGRMHSVAFGVDELRLAEYIDWVLERAATLEDVHIHVAPGSLAERAGALVRGLVAAGLARDLKPKQTWRRTSGPRCAGASRPTSRPCSYLISQKLIPLHLPV